MERTIDTTQKLGIIKSKATENHDGSLSDFERRRREEEERILKRREACKRYSQKSRQKEMAYLDHLQKEQKRLQKKISTVAPKVVMARRENAAIKAEVAEKKHRLNKLQESLYLKEVEYEQLSYWKDQRGIEIDPTDPEMPVPICDNCYESLARAQWHDQNHMVMMGFDRSQMANGFSAASTFGGAFGSR